MIATRIGEIGAILAPPGQKPAGILIEPERDTELFTQRLEDAMSAMLSAPRRKEFGAATKRARAELQHGKGGAGLYGAI